MIRGFLLLGLLALLPWCVSWGLDRLGVRIPVTAQFAAWVKGPPEEAPPGPPPGWREDLYLASNPDVAAVVRKGGLSSGYAHYVAFGQAEGRTGGFPPPDAPAAAAPAQPPPPPAASPPPPEPAPPTPLPLPPPAPPPPPPAAPAPEPAPVAVAAAPPPPPFPPPPLPPPRRVQAPLPPAKPPLAGAAEAPSPPTAPPAAGQISGIRVGTHQGFTRIVLDVDGPLRLDRPAAGAARSVGIELPNAVWRIERQGQLIARILAYRVEDSAPGASRLTLNAETPIQVKSLFLLPPDGDRRHRVVLDVVRADTGGPLPGRR